LISSIRDAAIKTLLKRRVFIIREMRLIPIMKRLLFSEGFYD